MAAMRGGARGCKMPAIMSNVVVASTLTAWLTSCCPCVCVCVCVCVCIMYSNMYEGRYGVTALIHIAIARQHAKRDGAA